MTTMLGLPDNPASRSRTCRSPRANRVGPPAAAACIEAERSTSTTTVLTASAGGDITSRASAQAVAPMTSRLNSSDTRCLSRHPAIDDSWYATRRATRRTASSDADRAEAAGRTGYSTIGTAANAPQMSSDGSTNRLWHSPCQPPHFLVAKDRSRYGSAAALAAALPHSVICYRASLPGQRGLPRERRFRGKHVVERCRSVHCR